MNLVETSKLCNTDPGDTPVVMSAADAKKFWIIFTHWPVQIIGGPVAGDHDEQEVA